jgi:hypothetical protein
MVRLLSRAQAGRSEPALFAGLVHVCRYCGLLEASIAADEQARRVDRNTRTSVTHTHFLRGEYARCLETSVGDIGYVDALALQALGRDEEARRRLSEKGASTHPLIEALRGSLRAIFERQPEKSLECLERVLSLRFRDPETLHYVSRHLAHLGQHERAIEVLSQAVSQGFTCFTSLSRDPWFDGLRNVPEYESVLHRTEAAYREARTAFAEAGGERVLGAPAS